MSRSPSTSLYRLLGAGVALGMLVLGLLTLGLIGAMNTGLAGLMAGLVLAVVPVPLYLALALWIDRYEKEPWWMLLFAFGWGATGAVFFSFLLNTFNDAVLSAAGLEGMSAALSAPWVEEIAKGAALLLLFAWKRDEFDNVTDGIVYACMVGLGFAMTENVSYYGTAFAQQAEGASPAAVMLLRGVMGPFAHPLFTAMLGIGLGLARETTRPVLRWAAPLLGFAGAMGLHFLWNLSATLGGGVYLATYLLLMVPTFLATLGLVVYSLRREARIIRANLAPYVAAGILPPAELERLSSVRGRTAAAWRALSAGGFATWRARRGHHQTASELAFHRWRVSRGISLGAQVDAEREREYVERLRGLA